MDVKEPSHVSIGPQMMADHTNADKISMFHVLAKHAADALKRVGVRGVVIDYGCGTGNVAFNLRDVATEVIGVDIAPGMVETFNNKANDQPAGGPPMKAILLPAEVSDLPEAIGKQADVAFSSLVYHHVPNPLATTLALAKSIRPGGKVLVIDFEPMNQQQNDHIMRAMVKLRQEMGEERSEGHHHPHPEHEGHHHHSGHDEGKGGEDKPAFSHVRGYNADQVKAWFDFPESAGVKMTDFFYERAFSVKFIEDEDVMTDLFVAGMTRA